MKREAELGQNGWNLSESSNQCLAECGGETGAEMEKNSVNIWKECDKN